MPWYLAASASYSVYGTAAPRPTTIACEKELLVSLVSATTFVASAVALMVAPPLVAVQLPLTGDGGRRAGGDRRGVGVQRGGRPP